MKRFLAIAASIALALPIAATQLGAQDASPDTPGRTDVPVLGFDPRSSQPFDTIGRVRQSVPQHQVRIERRVVIRIGPAASRARTDMLAQLPRRPMPTRFAEEDHGDCVDASSIVGVQPSGDNRLLFFTSDRQILAASLEDQCLARAFYAGFYIERSDDGRLCANRENLRSRAGASCQVENFSRLVAAAD
ncbi:hypothetical protein [Aurantiacibacter aquimixticola]|uniref:Uncharacterized protein n=1 Tax=Aurantiacibacter aquimixticola TaxID=1958945 RepID=A0A419RSX5_9SPHN|nr:hypothetical protein [Aurantiacibacter aquimixticola]RJY08844.1 hypothetical protein D6201_05235 [Aurantiacibacter aquimixticola]